MTKTKSLTDSAFLGALWGSVGLAITMVTRVAAMIVLARLLVPADYGVFSVSLIIFSLAVVFADTIPSLAYVQMTEVEERHTAGLFAAGVGLALVASLIILLLRDLAANLFEMPQLPLMLLVVAVVLVVKSLGTLPQSVLRRRHRFKAIAAIDVVAFAIGQAAFSVLLATHGFGALALMGGLFGSTLLTAMGGWILLRELPPLKGAWRGVMDMKHYALRYSPFFVFNSATKQADNFIVGLVFGDTGLGFYSRAYNIFMIPVDVVTTLSSRIIFPMMARVKEDEGRRYSSYRKALSAVSLIVYPISAFFVIEASEVVRILLGDQWHSVTPLLQIFACLLPARLIAKITETTTLSLGAFRKSYINQLFLLVFIVAGALGGSSFGLPGVAVGVALAILLFSLLSVRAANLLTGLSWMDFLRSQRSAIVLTAVAAGVVLFVRAELWSADLAIVQLVFDLGLATVVVACCVLGLPKLFVKDDIRWVVDQVSDRFLQGRKG